MAYNYYLKNKNVGKIYIECYNETDITLPKCLVPKHRPDETKQEYELRLKYAEQKLQQEAELLLSRGNNYEKKFNNVDNEIENLIETKRGKDSLKTLALKDQWKMERQNEEIKSNEMWQHIEALMRSQLRTFKRTNNDRKPKNNEEEYKSIRTAPKPSAVAENFKTEEIPCSKCTQLLNDIKQREYEYIKEFEKKINAEENGENFDSSALEKIGAELDALEIALKESQKTSKSQDDENYNRNLNNNTTPCEIKGMGIKTKFKSRILRATALNSIVSLFHYKHNRKQSVLYI